MIKTFVAMVAVFSLMLVAGCTSIGDSGDVADKTLAYACPALENAYVGLVAYQAAGGSISAKDMATAVAAYSAGKDTCEKYKAGTTTPQDALVFVISETAILSRLIKKN